MTGVTERRNELREEDMAAAFDVDKHNRGEYVAM